MADRNELRAIYLRSGLFSEGEDCYGFSDKGGHPLGNCEDFWQLLDDCYEAGRRDQRREHADGLLRVIRDEQMRRSGMRRKGSDG